MAEASASVPPVTWKVVSMRRPCVAQSSWCEPTKIIPLSKVNVEDSSEMLHVPPGEESTVRSAWKEPAPVDRLLVPFPSTVTCASEHEGGFRHANDVN